MYKQAVKFFNFDKTLSGQEDTCYAIMMTGLFIGELLLHLQFDEIL